MPLHQRQRVGERRVGNDGDRIDHHAALVALDLADLFGLRLGLHIAVDDADAAGLRQRDGKPRLGDGIHGGGNDRQAQRDFGGEPRLEVGGARQDFGMPRQEQDVVERQSFLDDPALRCRHSQLPTAPQAPDEKTAATRLSDARQTKVGSGS